MTGRPRTSAFSPTTMAAKLALAGVAVSLGALALAGPAVADPVDPNDPALLISNPGAPAPPGQPVAEAAPPVPGDAGGGNFDPSRAVGHVADDQAHYGSGSGPLGFIRDAWHQAKDPMNFAGTPDGEMPTSAPPPGAGPAPKLPPGYVSMNAPGSETPMPAADPNAPKPAAPPGYIRMDDGRLAPDPAGPPPAVQANGAPVPAPYVPVHSPPPPPLLPEDPGPPPF
jgi:hypothetical protein